MDRAEKAVALECASHACALFAEAMLRRGGGFMREVAAMASVSCPLHARSSGLAVPSLRAAVVRGGRGEAWLPAWEGGSMAPALQGEALRHDSSQPLGKGHLGRQFNSLQEPNHRPNEVPFFLAKPRQRDHMCLRIGQTEGAGFQPMRFTGDFHGQDGHATSTKLFIGHSLARISRHAGPERAEGQSPGAKPWESPTAISPSPDRALADGHWAGRSCLGSIRVRGPQKAPARRTSGLTVPQ